MGDTPDRLCDCEIINGTTPSVSVRANKVAADVEPLPYINDFRPMAQPLQLSLSKEQREELIDVRDHHEKPYMREKAAAVLKVAGPSLNGLLHERWPDTVRDRVHAYKEEGADGFVVEEGRGQKPAFSPDR